MNTKYLYEVAICCHLFYTKSSQLETNKVTSSIKLNCLWWFYLLTVDSPTSFISVKLWFMMIAVHLLSFIYPEKLDSNIFN